MYLCFKVLNEFSRVGVSQRSIQRCEEACEFLSESNDVTLFAWKLQENWVIEVVYCEYSSKHPFYKLLELHNFLQSVCVHLQRDRLPCWNFLHLLKFFDTVELFFTLAFYGHQGSYLLFLRVLSATPYIKHDIWFSSFFSLTLKTHKITKRAFRKSKINQMTITSTY